MLAQKLLPTAGVTVSAPLTTVARSGVTGCLDFGYWVMHTYGSIPREKNEAVPQWRDSELFHPLERLVIECAEKVTETPPTVDDEPVKKLGHLDQTQLVELTIVIGLENVRSQFTTAAGLTGQGFQGPLRAPAAERR